MTKFEYGRMNNTKFDKTNSDKKGNELIKGESYGISSITRRSRTRKRFN